MNKNIHSTIINISTITVPAPECLKQHSHDVSITKVEANDFGDLMNVSLYYMKDGKKKKEVMSIDNFDQNSQKHIKNFAISALEYLMFKIKGRE